jgi:hypothetical protein
MLDGAESVDVDADADLNVDVNAEVGGGVDLYGDVEIQHSTVQHSTSRPRSRGGFLSNPRHIRVNRWTIWSRWTGLDRAGPEMWRCTSSTRLLGSTSISRVTSHTGGRLFSCADTF